MRKIVFIGLVFLFICHLGQAADFSIKIAGASKYCLFKDINRGIDGYLDFWADLSQSSGGIIIDNKKPLHFGLSYSFDLILGLNSSYSMGLGVGHVRARNRSEIIIRYTDGRPETSAVVETTIEAVPIRLSVFRDYHLNRSLNAFVVGGLEIYPARFQSSSWPAGPGDSHHQKAHSVGIGLLYGAGLEIKVLSHVALVLEAQGNYAKIGSFRGKRESGGSTLPHEVKGTLYFEEMTFPPDIENAYPLLMIYETKPLGDRVRSARVDFSGFSLSAGVKIFF